jgi:hypothetical protein
MIHLTDSEAIMLVKIRRLLEMLRRLRDEAKRKSPREAP